MTSICSLSGETGFLPDKMINNNSLSGERLLPPDKAIPKKVAQGADKVWALLAACPGCLLNFQRQGSEVGVGGRGAEEDGEVSWLDGPPLGGTPAL